MIMTWSLLEASCDHDMSLLETSCDHYMSLLETSCGHYMSLLETYCDHFMSLLETSYKFCRMNSFMGRKCLTPVLQVFSFFTYLRGVFIRGHSHFILQTFSTTSNSEILLDVWLKFYCRSC